MKESDFVALQSWLSTPNTNDKTHTKADISDDLKVLDDETLGRCIIANESIPKDELIMKIPKLYLLNYLNVLKHISYWNEGLNIFLKERISNYSSELFESPQDTITDLYCSIDLQQLLKLTTHQLLTLYLVLEKRRGANSFWFPLLRCLPELPEYDEIPMTWIIGSSDKRATHAKIFNLLPKEVIAESNAQLKKFFKDTTTVDSFFTSRQDLDVNVKEEEYLWAWLAINTRSLYYQNPTYLPVSTTKDKEISSITMVPFVDFVNHKCEKSNAIAKQSKSGYEVTTTAEIGEGEHVWFTYGPHNDDFLQCEYGFSTSTLENDEEDDEALTYTSFNKYNTIELTNILSKLLENPKKKMVVEWLKQTGYYGDYTIGVDEILFDFGSMDMSCAPSHRTRIAIAALIEDEKPFQFSETSQAYQCPQKLEKFYQGYNDGEYYAKTEALILSKILRKIESDLDGKLDKLTEIRNEIDEEDEQSEMKIRVVEKLIWNRKVMILSV